MTDVQDFRFFNKLPYRFRAPAEKIYSGAIKSGGITKANLIFQDIEKIVNRSVGRIAGNDKELCEWAKIKAAKCESVAASIPDQNDAYLALCERVRQDGIEPLLVAKNITLTGAIKRMSSAKWWRRNSRKSHARSFESLAIKLNMVNRHKNLFISDEAVQRRGDQKRRNRHLMESTLAVNQFGDEYSLAELCDLSVSNPEIRRGELMLRMAGFDENAQAAGHVGEFYTWTAPSRMHAAHHKTGRRNRKYDWTTPIEAQNYICRQWEKARSELARLGIEVYGFRVCEPNHDGTPHWHMLFFMRPEDSNMVREVFRDYALGIGEDRTEKGAADYRFKAKRLDPEKGGAAGYLSKYISKNIDGFGIEEGDEALFDRTPETFAARVDAWASTWGIRQFQQIGGESVTLYRELRRFKTKVPLSDPLIESVRQPADDGDWCGYLGAMAVGCVGIHREWSDEPGEYGDPLGWKIVGVGSPLGFLESRRYQWTVTYEKKSIKALDGLGLLPELSASFSSFILPNGAAERPWSTVDNCTSTKFDHDHDTIERLDQNDFGSALFDQFDRRDNRNKREGMPIEVHRQNPRSEKIH